MVTITQEKIDAVRITGYFKGSTDLEVINHLLKYEKTETVTLTPNAVLLIYRVMFEYVPEPDEAGLVASILRTFSI